MIDENGFYKPTPRKENYGPRITLKFAPALPQPYIDQMDEFGQPSRLMVGEIAGQMQRWTEVETKFGKTWVCNLTPDAPGTEWDGKDCTIWADPDRQTSLWDSLQALWEAGGRGAIRRYPDEGKRHSYGYRVGALPTTIPAARPRPEVAQAQQAPDATPAAWSSDGRPAARAELGRAYAATYPPQAPAAARENLEAQLQPDAQERARLATPKPPMPATAGEWGELYRRQHDGGASYAKLAQIIEKAADAGYSFDDQGLRFVAVTGGDDLPW